MAYKEERGGMQRVLNDLQRTDSREAAKEGQLANGRGWEGVGEEPNLTKASKSVPL